MIFRLLTLAFKFSLVMALFEVSLSAQVTPESLEILPIENSPNPPEWKMFMKMSPGETKKLWHYHVGRGKSIGDWSWEWRLGWVRKCITSQEDFCARILETCINDDAVVVRSETASLLGQRFAGTGYKQAIKILSDSYRNPENLRNNKPLWVQYRILEAIKRIGGKEAMAVAANLASQHAKTNSYWKKINKF